MARGAWWMFGLLAAVAVTGCEDSKDRCAKVTCAAGKSCDPANGQCRSDAQLDGGRCPPCGGAHPWCDGARGACVACLEDAHCGPGSQCKPNGTCTSVLVQVDAGPVDSGITPEPDAGGLEEPPEPDAGAPGDVCASASALAFDGGAALLTVNTTGFLDQYRGSCGSASGREAVYRLSLAAAQDVVVSAQGGAGLGEAVDPYLYIRGPVAAGAWACQGVAELACASTLNRETGPATPEALTVFNAEPGDYFLFVDTSLGRSGPVSLDVRLRAPTPTPPNDTCAGALALTFNGSSAHAEGTTAGARQNAPQSSCARGGLDVVYSYTLTAAQDVRLEAAPLGGSALAPVLAVRGGACGAGTELGCGAGGPLVLYNQQPGTYFVWLSGAGGSAGAYALDLALLPPSAPPANDACAGALALSFTGDTAMASGTTRGASNGNAAADDSPSCSGPARSVGRDVVYTYTLAAPKDVLVRAVATQPSLSPVVYVRASCGSGARLDELACQSASGGTATLRLQNQPAGTYSVWVDSGGQGAGDFELAVELSAATPPPANDRCAGAAVIPAAGGSVSGTTLGARPDAPGACGGDAPDVAYTLTTQSPQDLRFEAKPSAGFQPVLSVRGPGGCGAVNELTCARSYGTGLGATAALYNAAPGTYVVWVGGQSGSSGAFTLEATVAAASGTAANDTCASPTALAFSADVAKVSGNTALATNGNAVGDASPSCHAPAVSTGKDLVYTYELTSPKDVKLTAISTTPGFSPVVYVRKSGACASTALADQLACTATPDPVRPSVTRLFNQPPGVYSVWVDGYNGSAGTFDLEVRLSGPSAPPVNDTCATATPLVLPVVDLAGTTAAAADDVTNTCLPTATGSQGDVFYVFTLATASRLTATVVPDADEPTYFPSLYLRDSIANCGNRDAGGSLGCINSANGGQSATLSVPSLAAGTYYLVVDSRAGGAFKLSVSADAVSANATNDTCATAEDLLLTPAAGVPGLAMAKLRGSTLGALNDATGPCNAATGTGADLVYRLATPADAGTAFNARALLVTENEQLYSTAAYWRAACGTPGAPDGGPAALACDSTLGHPHQAIAYAFGLASGAEAWLWADTIAPAGGKGPFQLEVALARSPALNETCATALPISPNASVAGTTLGARDDYSNLTTWYDGLACTDPLPGPDVVYAYTAPSTGRAVVTAVPERGYDVGLAVLGSCAQHACILTQDPFARGVTESASFATVAGHTYFIVVDAYFPTPNIGERGGFVLSVAQQ